MGLKPTDEGWRQLKDPVEQTKAILERIDKTNQLLEENNKLLRQILDKGE